MTSSYRYAAIFAFAVCCALLLGVHHALAKPQETGAYELALVDLGGQKHVLGTLPASVFAPRVSPDGKKVAFELGDVPPAQGSASVRLYVAELDHLKQRRALPMVGKGRNWAPIWSPDGERLVFLVTGDAPDALWWRRADGTGDAERLVEGRSAEGMTTDGRQLAFMTLAGDRDYGISLLDLNTGSTTAVADRRGTEQHSSRVSPDGRWIAYASNETGRHEIWVEPLPSTGKRYRITQTGGSHPVWSPDATHLYFDRDSRLFDVQIYLTGETPKASEPTQLPIVGFQQGYRRRQFDLMPDGKQFLMLFPRSGRL